jgi:hypothetical protein
MPTILAAASAGAGSGGEDSWLRVASVHRGGVLGAEPPFELGDGMSVWPFLSGRSRSSPRQEVGRWMILLRL